MRQELFICECHYVGHQMVISYDDTDEDGWDMIHVEIHLNTRLNFFKRFWHGMKFIFGFKSPYGQFEGLTIDPDDTDRLQDVVNYLNIAKINKDEDRKEAGECRNPN